MKTILLATSILAGTAGLAAAEVTLSGSARMGIIDDFGDGDDVAFTSRARVEFTLSGESDGGLAFGASFRADNAEDANEGTAGSVFISGAFGKLSMGDVDGAGAAAVGHVDGVGLTGLDDLNEMSFFANGGDFDTTDPSALYEYSAGAFSVFISATNPTGIDEAYGIGAKYVVNDMFTVSAAYEDYYFTAGDEHQTQYVLGADATFGGLTLKARYADANFGATQTSVSATYAVDALAVTAFYTDDEEINDGAEAYGLGAEYDLGGGAKVVGGYVQNETDDEDAFDLGLSFEF